MTNITFIGGGNMTRCIFDNMIATNLDLNIEVSSPHLEKLLYFKEHNAVISTDNIAAAKNADVIFLGVKPQVLTSVLEQLSSSNIDFKQKLIVSMAAGFKVSSIAKLLKTDRIIRIMPNTPCKIGLGVNAVYASGNVQLKDVELVFNLLEHMGMNIRVDSEDLLNSIGVVAGSAPAFLFRYLEAMIENGIRLGLEPKVARDVAQQVILGSVKLASSSPDVTVASLREAVTSKGGTTFEGLKVMTECDFDGMMQKTVDASLKRTKEFEAMF